MTGLDTNVLLRIIVRDDADQMARARDLVDRVYRAGSRCYVNDIVLCEFVWVLGSVYRFDRHEIAEALERLLDTPHFRVGDDARVQSAIAKAARPLSTAGVRVAISRSARPRSKRCAWPMPCT